MREALEAERKLANQKLEEAISKVSITLWIYRR